jgi:membrane-bound lytic murein transglycosylase D
LIPDPAASSTETSVSSQDGSSEDTLGEFSQAFLSPSDLWFRIRQGFAMPNLDNERVREKERWYTRQPDYIERMSSRGSRYLYHIVDELERRHMPTELALLPFVESAFNPTAISSARAEGMWQFMPGTGRTYQLTQNIFRDDRRDILESTRAALDYLERLHSLFDDWHLALAAYNWGEGNVQRAISRNQARGLPTDYASLRMPAETQNYVPKLQALKNIISDPESFSVNLIELPNHPYFVSVPINRDIDVALAARLAGMSVADFRTLNPSQKKPVILAAGTPQILLPYDNAGRFSADLAMYKGQLASWTAWVIPKTMRTSQAAQIVKMSEPDLRALNNIPPRMLVRQGSVLLIPRAGSHLRDVPENIVETASMALAPDLPPLRKVSVHAGRGETVASLARRYRINPAQIAAWNHLSPQSKLPQGHNVTLWLPASAFAGKSAKSSKSPARPGPTLARSRAQTALGLKPSLHARKSPHAATSKKSPTSRSRQHQHHQKHHAQPTSSSKKKHSTKN